MSPKVAVFAGIYMIVTAGKVWCFWKIRKLLISMRQPEAMPPIQEGETLSKSSGNGSSQGKSGYWHV